MRGPDIEPATGNRNVYFAPLVQTKWSVAGVEAAIWCETVTSGSDLEFLLLPRLAGIAERAWSPVPAGAWDEYRSRLAIQSWAWTRRGWAFFRSSTVDWQ